MNYKKTIFISIVLLILSVAAVSATDLDNNYVTDSSGVDDSLIESCEIQDSEILSDGIGTFDDLQVEINNAPEGSVLNLTRDYNGHYGSRIDLSKDLTIDGNGHTLNCLGEGGCSAFYSTSGNIVLKNLIIINGHNDYTDNGGAIYISGSAQYTIDNCTFEKNWAHDDGGAIYNDVDKPLTINNCKFISNEANGAIARCHGGAIYSVGELYIDNSLFDSNTVKNVCNNIGGAIYCKGLSIVTNSIFNNNLADDSGGAIHTENNLILIRNCQFLSNKVDYANSKGGAVYSGGIVIVENSVFKDNWARECGGAIFTDKNVYLSNSIFQSNEVDDNYGGAICTKNNVSVSGSIFKSNKANRWGGAIYSSDGGINVDNSTFEDNVGSNGGALYAQYVNVNSEQDANQPFNSFFINNEGDDERGGAIFSHHDVHVLNSVFTGNSIYMDGGAIYTGYDAYLSHCIFESNKAGGSVFESYGGAIRAQDDIYIDNCTFKDNCAHDYGGALYGDTIRIGSNSPTKQFTSFFINNKVEDNDGGAVYAYYDFYPSNAVFSGNTAYEDGGAVFCCDNAHVTNCLFESNKADGANAAQCEGGAIYCKDDISIDNSTFKDNYAYDYAGAIYGDNIYVNNNQGSDEAFNSFFIGNKAGDNDGGALYSYCDTHAKNAVFTGNSAFEDGGAVFCCDNAYITHCLFESNKADGAEYAQSEGGAIHCKDNLTVDNSTFNKNYAYDYGGAIYSDTLVLNGYTYFDSNIAYDNRGGAIWINKFREDDITYATFTNNRAGEGDNDDGGAICIDDENSITFLQCVFVNNHCNDEGGAIYLNSLTSTLSLKNNIFVSNSAGKKGQVVYNYGEYYSIHENWWGGKNPSSDNDELIEWKLISDNHHSDNNPLKLTFKLTPESCNVNDSVSAIVSFNHNDGSNCSKKMRTEYISFIPTENITFNNRTDHEFYMDTLLTPQKSGTYVITANLFGQLISKTLYVSDSSPFDLNGDTNNPDIFDNYGNDIANNVLIDNQFINDVFVGDAIIDNVLNNNQTGNNASNVNNASTVNNQSNSNAPVKSVSQSGNSNNLIYWALALVIIALCAIIVWRKMKN